MNFKVNLFHVCFCIFILKVRCFKHTSGHRFFPKSSSWGVGYDFSFKHSGGHMSFRTCEVTKVSLARNVPKFTEGRDGWDGTGYQ